MINKISQNNSNQSFGNINKIIIVGALKKDKKAAKIITQFVKNHKELEEFAQDYSITAKISREKQRKWIKEPFEKDELISTSVVLEIQDNLKNESSNVYTLPYHGHGDTFEASENNLKENLNKFSKKDFLQHLSSAKSGNAVFTNGYWVKQSLLDQIIEDLKKKYTRII